MSKTKKTTMFIIIVIVVISLIVGGTIFYFVSNENYSDIKKNEKPEMSDYKFTTNWLKYDNLEKLKNIFSKNNQAIDILELGTYEGRCAFYMLHNLCSHKDSKITTIDFAKPKNLEYNLSICNSNKLKFIQDDFFNIIPKLLTTKNKYDLIYIDGGKDSKITIFQIVNSWKLLKKNGILYLDDYTWDEKTGKRPKEAIDFFLSLYKNNYDIVFKNSQVAVIKK